MTQKRRFNYKDDDLTQELNYRLLGVLPSGLYRGFEWRGANSPDDLNLNLYHDLSGYKSVNENNVESNFIGKYITRHGVIIEEDADIVLPISANNTGDDRIDIVVVTHSYSTVIGGAQAVYSIIEGTPEAIPVAPSLTNPEKQLKLGELLVPSGATSLSSVGVTYTKSAIPFMGAHSDNFVYTDKENILTKKTTLDTDLVLKKGAITWDDSEKEITLGDGNIFNFTETGKTIEKIVYKHDGYFCYLIFENDTVVKQGNNIVIGSGGDVPLLAGDIVLLIFDTSGSLRRFDIVTNNNRNNKGALVNIAGDGSLNINKSYNFIDAGIGELKYLKSVFVGKQITIKATNAGDIILKNNSGVVPSGYKSILLPNGKSQRVKEGEILTFVENDSNWELVSSSSNDGYKASELVELAPTAHQDDKILGHSGIKYIKINNPELFKYVYNSIASDFAYIGFILIVELPYGAYVGFKTKKTVGNLSMSLASANADLDAVGGGNIDFLHGITDPKTIIQFVWSGTHWEQVSFNENTGAV